MNQMSMMVEQVNKLPQPDRTNKLSAMIGQIIKFAGYTGVVVEELNYNTAVVSLKNRTDVQNHIGTIHAVAMILLAETASGILLAMNVPEDKIVLAKNMNTAFVKRSKGDMKVVATITQEQIDMVKSTEKGEVKIEVVITDETGLEPAKCEAIWAWVPKIK